MPPRGYVLTNKYTGIVGCGSYILRLSRNINSKWQFLDCTTVAFSERSEQSLYLHSYSALKLWRMADDSNAIGIIVREYVHEKMYTTFL